MNERDSKRLNVGDRVRFAGQVDGTVIDTGYHAITVAWDDGQTGTIDHRDTQAVERAAVAND